MKATVSYSMHYGPDPFTKRANQTSWWVLWKITTYECGFDVREEPVAIFNTDSEARIFMMHLHAERVGDHLIRIPKDMKDCAITRL